MKTNLLPLTAALALVLSPAAFGADEAKPPGKESTSTAVPQPSSPTATEPAVSEGASGAGKPGPGKESTSTSVPTAPDKGEKKPDGK